MPLTIFSPSITVNVPECSDVAFVNEDKYLTCAGAGSHSGGSDGSGGGRGVVPLNTGCEGYNASNVQSLGGTILWCVLHDSDTPFCVDSENYTLTHDEGSPLALNITSTGELYIPRVTTALKGVNLMLHGNNLVNCSIFNDQGERCGDEVRLDLIIFPVGKEYVSVSI